MGAENKRKIEAEEITNELFKLMDLDRMHFVFARCAGLTILEQKNELNKFKQGWLPFQDEYLLSLNSDENYQRVCRKLSEVNHYLNYSLIEDYPKNIPDCWRDPNDDEIVLDKFKIKKEENISKKWGVISQKYIQHIEKVEQIRPSCIAQLISKYLKNRYHNQSEMYNHYNEAQKKYQKHLEHIEKQDEILPPLEKERKNLTRKHIIETVMKVSNMAPELFCVGYPEIAKEERELDEVGLYVDVVKNLSSKLYIDYVEHEILKIHQNIEDQ